MLAFADFYDIQRPVESIAKQIDAVEVIEDNLISAMALIDKVEKIEAFKWIANELEAKSKNFAVIFLRHRKNLHCL